MFGGNLESSRVRVRPTRSRPRRGAVLVLTALFIIVTMALLALSIDLGYMMTVQTELQRATDAAALAGAGVLVEGADAAELTAFEFFAHNPVANNGLLNEEGWEDRLATIMAEHPDEFQFQAGHWDPDTRMFTASNELPSTIRVTAARYNAPLFFGRALGHDHFDITAESVARFQPRDIVLVLDFSASMNDDSELRRIGEYGESARAAVEASLLEIYQQLGSPTFGNMQFEPQYISSNYTSVVKETLGLTYVPYPYPSGSWDNYISYVKSSSYINNAGYRKKYGYLTLVNYWLEQKPEHDQTPDLWMVSAQPVTAVKNAVGVFMTYIQEVDTDDRVALAVYNSPSQYALIEESLTDNLAWIEEIAAHRQAGHYDRFTNIGAGIRVACDELEANARKGAQKMIVLMTDGIANRPSDTSTARAYALDQAQHAAGLKYPIVTISLGSAADTALMQQIADITHGIHFNVPGGESVMNYEADLLAVFREIADDRPLTLVK